MQRIFTYPITEGNVANSKNAVEPKQEHWTKWMWNAVATYNFAMGQHRFDTMAGIEVNREDDTWFSAYKEDYIILSPDYMWPDAGTGTAQSYGNGSGYSLTSFFGKVNYNYADRYLASFTIRHDGSSRFGKNNRYATFPAVTLGWRVNQEKMFRRPHGSTTSSSGHRGDRPVPGNIQYRPLYHYVSNYGATENGGQSYGTSYDIAGTNGGQTLPSGFKRDQIGNDGIKWETTTQTNLGLDYAFLGNTLYGTIDWYYKKTKDILVQMGGHRRMGEGSSQWINAGEMENRGVEFNIATATRPLSV
jgi:hypothetical protein